MRPCEICGLPGQRHHIVYRSHGGLNIELNYAYLCPAHHTDGKDAVHNNRSLDLFLKMRLQRRLEHLFCAPGYHIGEIAAMVGYDRRRLKKRMKAVRETAGVYAREDVIRFFMGGKLCLELSKDAESGSNNEGNGVPGLEKRGNILGLGPGRPLAQLNIPTDGFPAAGEKEGEKDGFRFVGDGYEGTGPDEVGLCEVR